MFRLLGFIIGSLASIAALVLMVGMPDFHLEGDAVDEDRYETAIEKLREKQQIVQDVFDELPVEEMLEDAVPIAEEMIETVAEQPTGEEHNDEAPATDAELESQSDPVAELPEFEPLELSEPEWHAFWTPFRSEIAAKGFVRRLESVTGLDYRIVKVRNGVYQVTFSYLDDTERSTKLSQISAATGLDLSENLR